MIGVIADDFTGAAEIGGLGLRYGLKVEIRTSVAPVSGADLLIIATDTRSGDAAAAVEDMREKTRALRDLRPRLLYKKLDSVLRGHVLPELAAQMEVLGRRRALIIPANPAFQRTINNGIYYVRGQQLHETGFGRDPEFGVRSSRVLDILRKTDRDQLTLGRLDLPLPDRGFVVGEVSTAGDLGRWAGRIDETTLAAGASGFFAALLEQLGLSALPPAREPINWGKRKLFVCGSSFSASKEVVRDLQEKGRAVRLLPPELARPGAGPAELTGPVARTPELAGRCAAEIAELLTRHGYAVLAAGFVNGKTAGKTARTIRENMAVVTAEVMRRVPVGELLLEGGATASAVLGRLGMEEFHPEQQVAHGVIRMRVPGGGDLHVTMKPGSYEWPPDIRDLLE